ncbi:MAG: DUF3570 domain-containing protein [Acidobacteria bacterium]|nr:DUF3570 domain-containing protein [Acidobacteriota bacterium]
MQLDAPPRTPSIRNRLRLAACLLLASGAPAVAPAAEASPVRQLDLTTLLYSETKRVGVVEPTGRYSSTYADGQSFYLQFGVDSITGSSPTGASPSGQAQTVTSASGHTTSRAGDTIPLAKFHDTRLGLDGGWVRPFGLWTSTLTGHFSREKDYESIGAGAKLAVDLNQRLTTLTFGAGTNHDQVFPIGGITAGLADPNSVLAPTSEPKRVTSYLLGVSQILSRRWLVSVTGSRITESGYLTEPYKTLSLIDPATGFSTAALTEKRPSTRARTSVLLSSVYHFTEDVLSASYRYYTDDWKLGAHTVDVRYRHDVTDNVWLEPHIRYYTQNAADFFTPQLVAGAPLPDFATADIRLGKLTTVTAGATLGLRLDPTSGEWRFRVEYVGFMGDHHPAGAVGIQRTFDLYPTVNTATILVDYSLKF